MTTRAYLLKTLPLVLLLAACGGKMKNTITQAPQTIEEEKTYYSTDTTISDYGYANASKQQDQDKKVLESMLISSIVTLPYSADTSKKFIKKAQVKFKVKDMLSATYGVEDITRHYGGFITYTSLQTEIKNVEYADISEDSLLKRTHYTVVNTLTLRVPAAKLDSTLRSFTPFIDFLDYRTITAEDISLTLLANHLTQLRAKNQRLRIDRKSTPGNSSLEDITNTEEVLINRQEQSDASLIENMSLMDQVKYSTIELSIYQDEKIMLETVYNPKSLHSYNSGFGFKLKRSFGKGWQVMENVILFAAQFWMLIVLAGIVVVGIRVFRRFQK